MALTRGRKQKIIEDLKEKVAKQKAMVFIAFDGVKAEELFDLRKRLKAADCLLTVTKKTLLNKVFKEKKFDFDFKKLEGQLGLILGFRDKITPAKIAYKFGLENENLKILGGLFENEFREAEEIITLAKMPSREELLAKVIGSISNPISGFINVLQGNIKGLIYVLKQGKTQ